MQIFWYRIYVVVGTSFCWFFKSLVIQVLMWVPVCMGIANSVKFIPFSLSYLVELRRWSHRHLCDSIHGRNWPLLSWEWQHHLGRRPTSWWIGYLPKLFGNANLRETDICKFMLYSTLPSNMNIRTATTNNWDLLRPICFIGVGSCVICA